MCIDTLQTLKREATVKVQTYNMGEFAPHYLHTILGTWRSGCQNIFLLLKAWSRTCNFICSEIFSSLSASSALPLAALTLPIWSANPNNVGQKRALAQKKTFSFLCKPATASCTPVSTASNSSSIDSIDSSS